MLRTSTIRPLSSVLCRRSITFTSTTSAYDHRAIADGHKSPNHRRKPARGGQNLSDRYVRLENSLRGKEAFSKELKDLTHSGSSIPVARIGSKKAVESFHGFEVPEEPKMPADDGA
ncbi:hypothetical protein GALMADRAFT_252584 [Galerina marginata CBS 339.88]|uniref:Uncharacterized protein n=1 Tax=Galerina marginata (strain CBS 339.88) TaxID=685588 RepID=A0A067T0H0_GALM3|nr:hypothetical protein GALMADRAFT_252584 [Galerina marginata CBS 339.88]